MSKDSKCGDGLPIMGEQYEFELADLARNIRKTSEFHWRLEADKAMRLPGAPERNNHKTLKDFVTHDTTNRIL